MTDDVAEDFKAAIREGLRAYEDSLIAVLRLVVTHNYPSEVVAVAFEIFPDSWSHGFPALDESNSEYFIDVDGEARYPSSVDPGLLNVPYIITRESEESFSRRNPDLDTFTLGDKEFIPWFAGCWRKAGGLTFALSATIADHDSDKELNLLTNEWQNRNAAF